MATRDERKYERAPAPVPRKNADLRTFSQEDLNSIASRLNDRPRRVLDWDSPRQREDQVLGSSAVG
ncbi:hypothetical protein BS618_33790 [Rhodococcus erythropolis]|nr:hypothetical protein BS618_33790 [Rhodococcus erythropolis]